MRPSLLTASGVFAALLVLGSLSACTPFQVTTIPSPSQTARLRIFVCPLSGELPKGAWGKSHEEFAEGQIKRVEKMLERKGIYDVVSNADLQSAIGTRQPARWQLEYNNWALARLIANAVHADYALIVERGFKGKGNFYWENVLINATTGKKFGVYFNFSRIRQGEGKIPENTAAKAYRELFKDAKEDLLATAVKKSRAPSRNREAVSPEEAGGKSAPPGGTEILATHQEPAYGPPVSAGTSETASRVIDTETISFDDEPAGMGERLIVYDFESMENLKITALIISECLREEFFRLGRFTLVNRENILKVMEEMKFQQTGLVDEKQAVQIGKGMAADYIITGRLGTLGGLSILQAKRIDVQSFGTSAIASLKCKQGEEETLLNQLNQMVKKLAP